MSEPPVVEKLESSLSGLEQARIDVEQAESALVELLAELTSAPRAEKTAVSTGIEQALQCLRDARSRLVTVEETIASAAAVQR